MNKDNLIKSLKWHEVKADNKEIPAGWYCEMDDLTEVMNNSENAKMELRELDEKEVLKFFNKLPASYTKELAQALNGLIDDEECSYDHHGYCQTHFLGSPCEMKIAREAVARYNNLLKPEERK